jgi:hypothetical protein
MSDNKGFAKAILIMLNEDSEDVSTCNDDSMRKSIEGTPTKETIDQRRRSSISNLLSKDLMKTIDEETLYNDFRVNKFDCWNNYSSDACEEMLQRHIRRGWVCDDCSNFNYESIFS